MKQETGKINQQKTNSLSVQISLSGQAFLYTTVEGVRYGKFYTIDSLISHIARNKVTELLLFIAQNIHVTIPKDIFSESECENYLTAKYSSCSDVLLSNVAEDIAITYPMPKGLEIDIIKLKEMCEVVIYHSFSALILLTKKIEQNNISFSYINNYIYLVAKKDGRVKLIDCFELDQEKNIIDILEIISEKLSMNDTSVAWIGELSQETTDILIKRYNIV